MVDIATLSEVDFAAYLDRVQERDLLRFFTCGSVDDGKSTLIGRLLYDSGSLTEDQRATLERESHRSMPGGGLDYSLLVDGLEAEREQGITIDVAYRFFGTERRKFIVADTPGHEQYTRNMVTGASTSELAVLLADARKGMLTQTRRHAFISALTGIRDVILVVNKMDLVGYDEATFNVIASEFAAFAQSIGVERITSIPASALTGANVVVPAPEMPWYGGPALLPLLERVQVGRRGVQDALRLPVQAVLRPHQDFRGYAGTVVSGAVAIGQRVSIEPAGRLTTIASIITPKGEREQATAGQAITVTLADEVDVSRGDVIATADDRPPTADQFAAHVVWMAEQPLMPGRPYLLRLGTRTVNCQVTRIKHAVNVNSLEHLAAKRLELNDVALCNLALDQRVPFEPYATNPDMGAFILIDRQTNATLGCGMIDHPLRRGDNLHWQSLTIDKAARAALKGQKGCVVWFTGLSGAGKSTIANVLERNLHAMGRHTYLLDGDNVRHGLNRDLGFTDEDRVENIRRVAEVARLFVDAGIIVLTAFISPFRSERRMARDLFSGDEFIEVFVDTPLEVCTQRDPKGLYRKARNGQLTNFTGLDSAYEPPEHPELRLSTTARTAEELAREVVDALARRGCWP